MYSSNGERIRIFYTIGSLRVGGAEGQLVSLVTNLDRSRFEPAICCLDEEDPDAEWINGAKLAEAGVPVFRVRFSGFWGFRRNPRRIVKVARELARLVKFMREFRPHIFHGLLFWAYILGTFSAVLAAVPVRMTSRLSLGTFKSSKRVHLLLEQWANRFTDLVIANSEAVRRDAIVQEQLAPEKIVVAYNGIQSERFCVPPAAILKRDLGLNRRGPVVGVVANLRRVKGHRHFLEAWVAVSRVIPSAVALLVGDGPMREELESQVMAAGIGDSVRFLGVRRDIPELLALVDLAVQPSLEEGFPNAILEAMAAGKAVVATNVGGNPEAVVEGVTGLLVPPENADALSRAMLRLLSSPAETRALGAAGRERVKALFDTTMMVERQQCLYELMLSKKFPDAG